MKEQIFFYERAEKHKSKERTSVSFKRALFPGNDQVVSDQSGNNETGKWLKHSFGLQFLCPSDVEESFCEDTLFFKTINADISLLFSRFNYHSFSVNL